MADLPNGGLDDWLNDETPTGQEGEGKGSSEGAPGTIDLGSQGNTQVTYTINGQPVTKTLNEWMRTASKNEAADTYLSEAKRLAEEHRAAISLGQQARKVFAEQDPDAMRTMLIEMGLPPAEADARLSAVRAMIDGGGTPNAGPSATTKDTPALDQKRINEAVAQALMGSGFDQQTLADVARFTQNMRRQGLNPADVSNILASGVRIQGESELRRQITDELTNSGVLKAGHDPKAASALTGLTEKILYGTLARTGKTNPSKQDIHDATKEAFAVASALGLAPAPTPLSLGPGADTSPLGVDLSKPLKRPSINDEAAYTEYIADQMARKQHAS